MVIFFIFFVPIQIRGRSNYQFLWNRALCDVTMEPLAGYAILGSCRITSRLKQEVGGSERRSQYISYDAFNSRPYSDSGRLQMHVYGKKRYLFLFSCLTSAQLVCSRSEGRGAQAGLSTSATSGPFGPPARHRHPLARPPSSWL